MVKEHTGQAFVATGEAHALTGQSVDVRSFVKCLRIVRLDIHVTQIIRQNEQDVRAPDFGALETGGEHDQNQETDKMS